MLYFHSFWTGPLFDAHEDRKARQIELWEFEALTWLLSAMEIRRHSPLRLITDSRGLDFVRNTKLDWVYNGGITTALDEIPGGLDPRLFWAAGKIYAWKDLNEPAVSVDTDAVLWAPLQPTSPVMALHIEDKEWPWYARNEEDFAPFGFKGPEWNWSLHPLNNGVLLIENLELQRLFVERAMGFMSQYSEYCRERVRTGEKEPARRNEALLFAEQRLLVMCAHQLRLRVELITSLHPVAHLLARNPRCLHLWSSKEFYPYCAEARIGLCNYLITRLLEYHPESRRTLEHWKMDRLLVVDPKMQLDYRELPPDDSRRARFSLLRNVEGVVWVLDPNVDIRRKATAGSIVLPGETVVPEPGAKYEIYGASARDG